MKEIIREALKKVASLCMSKEAGGMEIVMLVDDLERIAEETALKIIRSDTEPRLGCATTGELLQEITTRIEIGCCGLDYKTYNPPPGKMKA